MRSRKKEGVYSMSILKRQVLFVLFAFAATLQWGVNCAVLP